MSTKFKRGDIWLATFGDVAEKIPVLIISNDAFNSIIASSTIIVLPILPQGFSLPSRVSINGAGVRIETPAFAACEQIRSINRDRLVEPMGVVANEAVVECERALTRLLGLKPMPQPKGWGM